MNTEKVSATNVRVNLTEVISNLDENNRVAITKHGKVIAYLVASEVEVEEIEDEEKIFEVDLGELAGETSPGPNYEPDPDLDGRHSGGCDGFGMATGNPEEDDNYPDRNLDEEFNSLLSSDEDWLDGVEATG
jgi:antitoxin (DNA-binding transcriptional repressor) of toxin-antitoxin stability system